MKSRKNTAILLGSFLLIMTFSQASGGNDFVYVDLRTDIEAVTNSLDYQVWIASAGGPGGYYPTFTTAWIGVYLDNQPGTYGMQFSQVGLMSDSHGIYWFVYSESGANCRSGKYAYWNDELNKYLGCKGELSDLVGYGQFHKFELVSYGEGFWIARVEDNFGVPHDVAKILSTSTTIYHAEVVMEEGWPQSTDPYENGLFHIKHPQFNNWPNGFVDWPESDLSLNLLDAYPPAICPQYYGSWLNLDNDPYYWVAGSGGVICDAVMFPAHKIFLPLIKND